jgi:hypothetical protein
MALPETGGEGERMLAKVLTGAVVGLDGALVDVEVDVAPGGMPNFLTVGPPDAAVQEAREPVRGHPGYMDGHFERSSIHIPTRESYY